MNSQSEKEGTKEMGKERKECHFVECRPQYERDHKVKFISIFPFELNFCSFLCTHSVNSQQLTVALTACWYFLMLSTRIDS